MLYSARRLNGWKLAARDGEIGHAREVYFDDRRWVIRHVVADTGGWLFGRKVLISPHSIGRIDLEESRLEVALTRQEIKDAPDIDTDKPVSRQHEIPYYDYYGYPYYWAGPRLWGLGAYPMAAGAFPPPHDPDIDRDAAEAAEAQRRAGDPHLRSSDEMLGYDIEAADGSIGHVDDLLFDERSWQIRYVVVDTGNWLPGRHVLMPSHWIAELDWSGRLARIKMPREAVRESPDYEPRSAVPEERLRQVQRHFEGWQ